MTEDSIILLFKAFFAYKSTYISYFKQKIACAAKSSASFNRKNAIDRLQRYIKSFQSNFFYVEAFDRYPDFCIEWLDDFEIQCMLAINEVFKNYGKEKKQTKI